MSEEQSAQAELAVARTIIADPLTVKPSRAVDVPPADQEWRLPGGFARVFHGDGARTLQRPVIIADGFNLGRSDLDVLYQGLESTYPFMSRLRRRGRSAILLGFDERSASILANAETAQACITRTIAEQKGDAPLMVGGFSMGGLVTRTALAKMEYERHDHRTQVYFSYDTPHRGGVVPIAVQAFAHFIPVPGNDFARQIDSPASREMLWRHHEAETGVIGEDPLRTEYLATLRRYGGYPSVPRKIGVANGSGDGTGLDVPPGETALRMLGVAFPGTTLYTQASGYRQLVAELKRLLVSRQVHTDEFPELDGAPGGTLDTYRIIADALTANGGRVELRHPTVCFVPTVSAVDIRDIDNEKDLYASIANLSPDDSGLDEFLCSSVNTGHTAVTQELCDWLLNRLPG